MVREGQFREDLFYRLSVATIHIPPLRERKADIPLIIEYLMSRINSELHNDITGVDAAAVRRMSDYPWPGNVRELENILTKAALQTKGDMITDPTIAALLLEAHQKPGKNPEIGTTPESEKDRLTRVLTEARWHYGKACEKLGISRPTLRKKMKACDIPGKPRRR